MNDAEKTKPVCQTWQLNKPLEGDLKTQFQNLFTGEQAWRISFKGRSPAQWLKDSLDIDLENPTLRDAVAVDLVKLDDPSVSNDYISTTSEHMCWSCSEHERWMLNRNFRIHLANLENGWSSVKYTNGSEQVKRTAERTYQGPRLSKTLLKYFQDLFNHYFSGGSDEVYVPFTNANDFINEIALIPNTHPDFRSISSRAYYDMKWVKYKRLLGKFGISAVATFALVDFDKDKTHTGEWLVKVQRRSGSGWQYIVAKIDVEGQVKDIIDHWQSERNEILSVCEDDFKKGRASSQKPSDGVEFGEREVPMVHSTTSSHYSVFRQRIPEYDLREVRHYLQFKTRLEGMELMLKILKRNVHLKEVQASDCFARETMCISRLFEEFKRNEPLMELVMQYYDYLHQYDEAYEKLVQLRQARFSKQDEMNRLVQQYNALGSNVEAHRPDRNLDKKLELGGKIRSLRLEIDKTLHDAILALQDRLVDIEGWVQDLNRRIDLMAQDESQEQEMQDFLDSLQNVFAEDGEWAEAEKEINKKSQEMNPDVLPMNGEPHPPQSSEDRSRNMHFIEMVARHIHDWMHTRADDDIQLIQPEMDEDDERHIPELVSIDTSRLQQLVLLTERWKGRMLSMGYELMQMKQMLTMCEDATIKVRRLVHNFKERMERTEEDVWDESHQLRPDFNFKAIAAASLKDIILLHDWYASPASGKTYDEMGFSSEEEFMKFRRRCNTVSYNLRKNQYAQLLAIDRHRLENAIMDIQDKMRDSDSLHWKDKYGWEAKKEEQEEQERQWSVEDASLESVKRVQDIVQEDGKVQVQSKGTAVLQKVNERFSIFARADREIMKRLAERSVAAFSPQSNAPRFQNFNAAEQILAQKEMDERQYRKDAELMRSRTLAYLKDVGVADGEEELERLATMNKAAQFKGDVNAEMRKVEEAKRELDKAKGRMERQRNALKDIISQTTEAERKAQSLESDNRRIFDICVRERSRLARNRLLLKKIENETKIAELKTTIKDIKSRHLSDFSGLERMRRDVDRAQAEYDSRVKEFKQTIGSDRDAMESMIVGIYNRFQDEILNGGK